MAPDHPIEDRNAPDPLPLAGERVRFAGALVAMSRRDAVRLVSEAGGEVVSSGATLVVLGDGVAAGEPRSDADAPVSAVVDEVELWARLGAVGHPGNANRLYSPAMLADLVAVPLAAVRRWERRGALLPTKRINRLALYDFGEARLARLLAELLATTGKLDAVDRALDELGRRYPALVRPLAELNLVVGEGGLLVRDGDSLTEPGGQKRLDFDSTDAEELEDSGDGVARGVLPMPIASPPVADEARGMAGELHDRGDVRGAIEAQRLALLGGTVAADDHFTLAEMLYAAGEPGAARERYYAALELDGEYLEARVNLGCVLGELGEPQLAIAAFRGALETHEGYADAHYQLAVALDRTGEPDEGARHWRRFLEVAPDSPWGDEARRRLGLPSDDRGD
ncbi:MAG: tetratricopeptide repeat protein [Lacipirellulaceae bacterium]